MVSVFCVGVGEFLTFSAMVLAILVNMGQITENIVARSIYWASLDTTGFTSGGTTVPAIFATSQSAPEGAMNGLKNTYDWGLYNYCGGSGKTRACSNRSFGYEFRPLNVLTSDVATQYTADISGALNTSKGKFTDSSYLGKFSKASSLLAFIGTITIFLSFIVAFLAHRFAFLLASLLALLSSGIFFVAAAIWTAILYKSRETLSGGGSGLVLHYGNALWMEWAAALAAFLSVIPLLIACVSGRESKY